MHLKLLSDEPLPTAFEPTAFDLSRSSTRPGTAHQEIHLELGSASYCSFEGLDPAVCLGLLIEAGRVLDLFPDKRLWLVRELDVLASQPCSPTLGGDTRLHEYGRQLRLAASRARQCQEPFSIPTLLVPYRSLTAWRRASITAGISLNEWARAHLDAALPGHLLWEAAAAECGETLAEWMLSQAARR